MTNCNYSEHTKIQRKEIQKQIEELQAKLEELENQKTPVEEAYKRVYGDYPVTDITDTCWDGDGWNDFQSGYNAAKEEENEWKNVALEFGKKLPVILPYSYNELSPNSWYRWVVFTYDKYMEERDKECGYTPKSQEEVKKLQEKNFYVDAKTLLKSNWEPTPQTPEQVADGLKEAFEEAVKQGVVSSSTKPQTLYDVIADWWDEIFVNGNPSGQNIESLVEQIEKWLPKPIEETCGMKDWDSAWTIGYNNYRNTLMEKLK